jgi:mono/diheme cytochrome c family protein
LPKKRRGYLVKKILAYIMVIIFLPTTMLWAKSAEENRFDQGKNLYDNKCQICHGADGKGNGPAASSFNPRPVNLTDPKFWQQKDVDKTIINTIKHGHGMMPPMGLSSDQIKAVIDYMSHAFKPGP